MCPSDSSKYIPIRPSHTPTSPAHVTAAIQRKDHQQQSGLNAQRLNQFSACHLSVRHAQAVARAWPAGFSGHG